MVVDDIFPITINGKLVFSEPNPLTGNNLWPIILEKAWAKLNVNYEHTCAGWMHECARVFTGAGADDYISS